MPAAPTILERPQRWDAAFDADMADATLDSLLATAPFSEMDAERFPKRTPLREILRNDTRILRFRKGEIIVRQGDYGTSAFLILKGEARVVLKPDLDSSLLGRQAPGKKGFLRTLAQLWNGSRPPETFSRKRLRQASGLGARRHEKEVHVFLQDVPRVLNEHRTVQMAAGDLFGEIAALSRMPRTSTIFADSEDVKLLEIRWQGLRDLMKYDDALRTHINRIYRERALASYLVAMPMFRHLSEEQIGLVAAQIEFVTSGDYDWSGEYKRLAQSGGVRPEKEPVIAQEGDYPNGVVLLRAGFARVTQKLGGGERTLNYIGAGQSYGFREIVHNWRNKDAPVNLQFSLRAIGYAHLLIVPTRVMEEIVLPSLPKDELPAPIETANDESDFKPAAENGAREKVGAEVLEFLTENRFFNGTASMVIDLDRCTRCDDCVRACASTHDNNPRFLRHGPTAGSLMVANACMHCADPVCMIGCPTGAIHRESFAGQVVINPDTCIGCKACFNNCPYDAIRMVEVRDENGAFMVDKEMKPIAKATKCDLCVESYGGPACERACPHGALTRINLNNIDALAKWLKL
ncbi:MAG TPA: 4Fe-4S dicluster domain-containing protein [Verrucomicrobiae bacterium]|jgi:Fe-S-cluster-containing dehydrogenase component/CRP-like cAMP-binding protein|nr:4Fe-4S dicluster domain-containing protein [Verrucomicrobiae bacterium]